VVLGLRGHHVLMRVLVLVLVVVHYLRWLVIRLRL